MICFDMAVRFEIHKTPRGVTSLKPQGSTYIDHAIASAIEMAYQKNERVILTFNKKRLFVGPKSDNEAVKQKYYEALANRSRRTRRPAFAQRLSDKLLQE